MPSWEYRTLQEAGGLIDPQLNELGAVGWEVVSAAPIQVNGNWVWATLLRRPIADALSGVRAHHADQRQVRQQEQRAEAAREFAAEGYDLARGQE